MQQDAHPREEKNGAGNLNGMTAEVPANKRFDPRNEWSRRIERSCHSETEEIDAERCAL